MNTETTKTPYIGSRQFEEGERDRFFGRDREARDLFALAVSERLILFYAQSGAGKSSLVNTYLIPDLRAKEFHILTGRVSGDIAAAVEVENIFVYNLMHSLLVGETIQDADGKSSIKDLMAKLKKERPSSKKVEDIAQSSVLILDQFEELFSTHHEAWTKREDFFLQLAEAMEADPYLSVILVMREDYIASLDPYARLVPDRLRMRYYMQRLGREAAIKAVKGPVENFGRHYAPGVAEKLVDDLSSIKVKRPDGTLGIEPGQFVEAVQLQVVCISLWEKLDKGDTITEDDLRKVGDVDDALGRYYADRIAGVARQKQVKERDLREWIEKKLIAPGGIRNVVLQDAGSQTDGISDDVIQLLQSDIIRAEKRGGATWYELTHDRLVEPIIENNREWNSKNSSPFRGQAEAWKESGKNEDQLLSDAALLTAEKWAEDNQEKLTKTDIEFLDIGKKKQKEKEEALKREAERVREEQEHKLQEQELAAAQKLADEQARSAKRARNFNRIALTLTAVAILAAGFAFLQSIRASAATKEAQHAEATAQSNAFTATIAQGDAQINANDAATQQVNAENAKATAQVAADQALAGSLAAQADSLKNSDYKLALLLSLEAYKRDPSLLARTTLFQLLQFTPYQREFGLGSISSVAVSQDGNLIAMASCANVVSANNHNCASQGIQLFTPGYVDRNHRKELAGPGINFGLVYSLAFHQYGQKLFLAAGGCVPTNLGCADKRGQITIWDVTNYGNPALLYDTYAMGTNSDLRHTKLVKTIAFSPDGKMLASGSYDQTIILWDVSENGQLQPKHKLGGLEGHSSFVNSVAFSPDGKALVSAGDDKKILVWDLSQLSKPPDINPDHSGPVTSIAFYPSMVSGASDPVRFASASNDNTVLLWDWDSASGSLKNPVKLQGHTGYVTSVAFNADGTQLASAGFDDSVILWDTKTGAQIGPRLLIHSGIVNSIAFGKYGNESYLISGSDDRTVIKWDLSARNPINISFQLKEPIPSGQLSEKNDLYEASINGQQIEVKSVSSGDPFLVISGLSTQLSSISFDQTNPNTLITVNQNQTLTGWVTAWGIDPDSNDSKSWVSLACNAVGSTLTKGEWVSFISRFEGQPPKETCVTQP